MNDYDIDAEVFAAHVHDAERMRTEALRLFFGTCAAALKRLGVRAAALGRSIGRRRNLNLALPAPHH